jgi:hypothetical protein
MDALAGAQDAAVQMIDTFIVLRRLSHAVRRRGQSRAGLELLRETNLGERLPLYLLGFNNALVIFNRVKEVHLDRRAFIENLLLSISITQCG